MIIALKPICNKRLDGYSIEASQKNADNAYNLKKENALAAIAREIGAVRSG